MSEQTGQLYEVFLESGSICTDTRNQKPGSIYFALKGERFDGNKFAIKALQEGCRLAVVDDNNLKNTKGCFWVPDVLKSLQDLARLHRQHLDIPVIGITGSNGKTTTKELIAAVLAKRYSVWFTRGNLNNHIGVPLTLLSIPPGTQIAVVEMGANHIGEIGDLCNIALPNHGLITNIGKAHLEGFGSLQGVRKGKGELFDFLKKHGGEIFVNVDSEVLLQMAGDYPWIGYGTGEKAVVKASGVSASPLLTFEMTTTLVTRMPVKTSLTGDFNLENVLAAAAVGHYFGIDADLVKQAVEEYVPRNNRSQFFRTERNSVLLDAYNANPTSMKVALENFKGMSHSRKILILGSMKELGEENRLEHEKLISFIQEGEFTACYLTGIEFEGLVPVEDRFSWYRDTDALKSALKRAEISDALVLVKGSRANRLETVVEVL